MGANKLKVAYILHRFPYLTETFIMREMYWIREHGIKLYIFSLLAPKHDIVHDQAQDLLHYTRYSPYLSWKVIKAQFYFFWRSPMRYLNAFVNIIGQTRYEPAVLLRALVLFPKSVYFSRLMEELEIEHIHAHFAWLEGIAAGVIHDLVGISFTIHPHAFGLFSRNQRDVRRELENASRVVTIANYHRNYIANLCPLIALNDIEVVHCGIETDRFSPIDRAKNINQVRILSVGRLIEKKGFKYLIDACKLLSDRGLDFRCDIVGDGPQGELQSQINKYGLQNVVKLLGAFEQNQVLRSFKESDIFSLPCVIARNGDRDGIPVVLMEAMACQLPVVTTGVTGIPDLVHDGETGLLVAQRNASELADALQCLVGDSGLRLRLGENGRQKVLEEFNIQLNVVKMAAIFRQVSQNHQNQPA